MADNTYILKLKIDPSSLFGTSPNHGPGGKKGGDKASPKPTLFDSMFGKLTKPLKGLGKLGIIAFAVTGIFAMFKQMFGMFVSASPMLEVMMKLLNTAVTFILRPIGDFIGFFLRPILIYMLRYIAIPFYRHFMPIGRQLGALLGQPVADILKGLSGNLDGINGALGKSIVGGARAGLQLGESFGPFGKIIFGMMGAINGLLLGGIASIFGQGEAVANWFEGVTALIEPDLKLFGEGVKHTKTGVVDLSNTFGAYNTLLSQDGITGMNNLITGMSDATTDLDKNMEVQLTKLYDVNGNYVDEMGNSITLVEALAGDLETARIDFEENNPLTLLSTWVNTFIEETKTFIKNATTQPDPADIKPTSGTSTVNSQTHSDASKIFTVLDLTLHTDKETTTETITTGTRGRSTRYSKPIMRELQI